MHELLLLSPLPASRHLQLLNILAGVSAMQPVPILEKHLIFKPNRREANKAGKAQVGGAQDVQTQTQRTALKDATAGDVFYVQVVGSREDQEDGRGVVQGNAQVDVGKEGERKGGFKWMIQFRDLPEVVRSRPVTSRLMADIPIASGDPVAFMQAMDYSYVSSYHLSGYRFTHQNISLLLYRIILAPSTAAPGNLLSISEDIEKGQLFDPSGAYLLQASIRVQDGSKVELVNRGMTELLNLKETLKGVVELEVGDRLAMDTRMR